VHKGNESAPTLSAVCPFQPLHDPMVFSMLVNASCVFLLQEHREEILDERELSLRAKEDEVVRVHKTLYAQADDIIALCVPFPLLNVHHLSIDSYCYAL
jgi:hypothetical protein